MDSVGGVSKRRLECVALLELGLTPIGLGRVLGPGYLILPRPLLISLNFNDHSCLCRAGHHCPVDLVSLRFSHDAIGKDILLKLGRRGQQHSNPLKLLLRLVSGPGLCGIGACSGGGTEHRRHDAVQTTAH